MPCYTKYPLQFSTKLQGVQAIEEAAKLLGWKFLAQTIGKTTQITLQNASGVRLFLTENEESKLMEAVTEDGSFGRTQGEKMLRELSLKYGEIRVKEFARKKGYTIKRDVNNPLKFNLEKKGF